LGDDKGWWIEERGESEKDSPEEKKVYRLLSKKKIEGKESYRKDLS